MERLARQVRACVFYFLKPFAAPNDESNALYVCFHQIQEAQKLLQMPDADWKACSDAMEELAVAVEVMGEADSKKEAVKLLTGISVRSQRPFSRY
jgi:hypothetical protein